MSQDNIVVIPARLESTRLARKVLLEESGKYLLQHVYEQALKSKKADRVVIATDSEEVFEACKKFDATCVLTSRHHKSGSDRIAEATKHLDCKRIVNVQADEPLIDPQNIDTLFSFLEETSNPISFVTLCEPLRDEDIGNENAVKVYIYYDQIVARTFTRKILPSLTEDFVQKHVGVYGYTKQALTVFTSAEPTESELSNKLEQLRILDLGFTINVLSSLSSSLGIDTREDYDRFLSIIRKGIHDS